MAYDDHRVEVIPGVPAGNNRAVRFVQEMETRLSGYRIPGSRTGEPRGMILSAVETMREVQPAARPAVAPVPDATAPREPFATVVREHLDRLYGFCVRVTGNTHDGEDLLQDTLVRAMSAYEDLREPGRARGWLFKIATNVWRDQYRKKAREVTTTPLDGMNEDTFSLFQTIAVEDPFPYSDELHLDFLRLFRDEDVAAVFGSITPAFRLPLILTVLHGFACKEAAAILDVPLGTLLSRLHRGRKQLERGLWTYAVENRLVSVADEDER